MCSTIDAIHILEKVYSACNPIFNYTIKDAFLYGSYARGDYTDESDVDILLIIDLDLENFPKYRNAVASVTSKLSLEYDVTVSVTVHPLAQFVRYCNVLPYYMNVIKDGIRYSD